jgi:hypothetical protein
VTEQDLPNSLARNIELLHDRRILTDRLSLPPEQLYAIARLLTDQVKAEKLPLRKATSACDAEFGLTKGAALTVVYYLLANRYWEIDMYTRLNPGHRLTLLGHTLETLNPMGRRN